MNARDKKLLDIRPDEWGFYDPDEAGVAAVMKRLGTRVRATTRKPVTAAAPEPAKTTTAPALKESPKAVVATTIPAAKEPAKAVAPRRRKA